MSVLDQFRTAEQRVAERLRELKPLADEYRALEQVAQRLGLGFGEEATATAKQRPASRRATAGRRRSSKTKARSAPSKREETASAAITETSAGATPGRGGRGSRSSGDKGPVRSNRGSRREQDVLRLVNQRPGITVREIAKELGVDATGLYRPVHKLDQEGAISKQGAALQPTGR